MKTRMTVLYALALLGGSGAIAHAASPPVTSSAEVTTAMGAIVGVVTGAGGAPVARATVTAVRADGGGIRATVSSSDGVYSFSDLPTGTWSIISEADGYRPLAQTSLVVIASRATRHDIAMAGGGAPPVLMAPATGAPVVAQTPMVPEALQTPAPGPAVDTYTPFAVGYLGWMNGTSRESAPIFDTKFFTPEIRFDANYLQSFNRPQDHTIVGSTEEFRSSEFQIEQVSFGGDFHWDNVRARFLSMFGLFAVTTPRNDASSGVGQWDLQGAYKYFSEANAGYHFDVNHGLNVDVGMFVSYIGLFSYYNFDNWTYQPSFVSSNTPWFFNGLRVQWFPTQTLKIEPWLINGWQSYGKFNSRPGFGGQILWIPNDSLKLVFNTYVLGQDNLAAGSGLPNNGGNPNAAIGLPNPSGTYVNYANVTRMHEDDSIVVKYYDANGEGGLGVSRMAFSLTADLGCESGGGVHCTHGPNKANFVGLMGYNRIWFDHNLYAVTLGGGFMNNPGRYLALVPPINGATAQSGTPYFTENPGQKLFQWDTQLNFQYMPKDWITWWTELTYRHSDVPYWSGQGGVTPPSGNTGAPSSFVCNSGSVIGGDNCAGQGGVWYPDLRTREVIWGAGVMVKF
jgi:Putative beta-barrel porin-2, OmpL-like. bbp2/Carboxypeptidase regulatory-like domain